MQPTRFVLAAIVAIAGCAADAEPRAPAPKDDLAARVRAIQARMHLRYAVSRQIADKLARGELLELRALARGIATLREDDVLDEWKPAFERVRDAATRLGAAPDLRAAARGLADLGGACAGCHETTHAKLPVDVARPATGSGSGSALAARMLDHYWAIGQLWDGLVGPSPRAWNAGASALAGAPLEITAERGSLGIADDVARVRLDATRAAKTTTTAERVRVYGDILTSCAHCHAAIRDPALAP